MLRHIRKQSSSWIAKAFIVIIAASFGLLGAQSFILHQHQHGYVDHQQIIISIDDIDVPAFQYRAAARNLATNIAAQSGDNDPEQLEQLLISPEFNRQVYQQVLVRGLESSVVERNDFQAAITDVNSYIVRQPAFSSDGAFNASVLQNFLQRNNLSLEDYQDSLRGDISLESFNASLQASDFVVDNQLEFLLQQRYAERDFSVLPIDVEAVANNLQAEGSDLDSYWEQNSQLYQSEPLYDLEYLLLDIEDIKAEVVIDESQLLEEYAFYQQSARADNFAEVAHILLSDANASQRAEFIRSQLDAGFSFAELAQEYSDDFATRNNGGSFGSIELSSLPQAVADVLLDLPVGEVSQPVRSEFGLHLVLLEAELEPTEPLEQVRAELEDNLRTSTALSTLLRQVDELADLSFNAGDLQSVATSMGLDLQRVDGLSLSMPLAQQLGAAFATELSQLSEADINNISDLVELQTDQSYMVYRLLGYQPAQQQELDQVLSQVEQDWRQSQARTQARLMANEIANSIAQQSEFDRSALDFTDLSLAVGEWRDFEQQSVDKLRQSISSGSASDDIGLIGLGFDVRLAPGQSFAVSAAPTIDGNYAVVVLEKLVIAELAELSAEQLAELRAQKRETLNRSAIIARRANWQAQADVVIDDDWFADNAPLQ